MPKRIFIIFVFACECEYTFECSSNLRLEHSHFFELHLFTCYLNKTIEQIKPIKVYDNFKDNRLQLIKDQKDKTGVYCLVNIINGNLYIGSSVNLAIRMRNYLNTTFLKNEKNKAMPIVKALLKYGQDNFAVLIVEHTDLKNIAIRETH